MRSLTADCEMLQSRYFKARLPIGDVLSSDNAYNS